MSAKHLSTGAQCPPLVEGKLRIYSMRFCPFAQRALLVAAAKEIPHDVVNINLKKKPEFILAKNPGGKVPTIETSKGILYESLIVSDFLDETYPGRRLRSLDSFTKALDRLWVEQFSSVISLYYKSVLCTGDITELEKVLQSYTESILPFEEELSRRGTLFFSGNDAPGMLDYMIWPWMERVPVINSFHPDQFNAEEFKKKYPLLTKWDRGMREDSAVKQILLPLDIHFKYATSFKAGNADYDLLD